MGGWLPQGFSRGSGATGAQGSLSSFHLVNPIRRTARAPLIRCTTGMTSSRDSQRQSQILRSLGRRTGRNSDRTSDALRTHFDSGDSTHTGFFRIGSIVGRRSHATAEGHVGRQRDCERLRRRGCQPECDEDRDRGPCQRHGARGQMTSFNKMTAWRRISR